MENIKKTTIFTAMLSLIVIISAYLIQIRGENDLGNTRCSYLDPMLIDILAFSAALFLIIEAIYKIIKNKDAPLKSQITRLIRIAFGCAIVTLHVMQFLHK